MMHLAFLSSMCTLSVFASLTKAFQLASSVQVVDKTVSSGTHSLAAKSTSSAYSHYSGMFRVEISGSGLDLFMPDSNQSRSKLALKEHK